MIKVLTDSNLIIWFHKDSRSCLLHQYQHAAVCTACLDNAKSTAGARDQHCQSIASIKPLNDEHSLCTKESPNLGM